MKHSTRFPYILIQSFSFAFFLAFFLSFLLTPSAQAQQIEEIYDFLIEPEEECTDTEADPGCEDVPECKLCGGNSEEFKIDFDGRPWWKETDCSAKHDSDWQGKNDMIKDLLKKKQDEDDIDENLDIDSLCTGDCPDGSQCLITGIIQTGNPGSQGVPYYTKSDSDGKRKVCVSAGVQFAYTYYVTCGCRDPEGDAEFPGCSMPEDDYAAYPSMEFSR